MNRAAPIGFFAMALAAAGLPLYIHLPRFAQTELGLSLGTVGIILIAIRALDFVQDPALGWMVDRLPRLRRRFVLGAVVALALGFLALFALPAPIAPALWLGLVLAVIFTAYSLATILFYGQTRALSAGGATGAMIEVAKWRELGALCGIILAAALPSLAGYPLFGITLALLILLAGWCSRPLWNAVPAREDPLDFKALVTSGGGALLLLTLVNSLPVAMTSTLFVFFVEDRLLLTGFSGVFLILFFVSAALSVPIWSKISQRLGLRLTLISAMSLAILAFAGAGVLTGGEYIAFGLICVASGFALGADMLLLPALFSSVLARANLQTGQAFGFWSFTNKLTLAIAAGILLPLLDFYGFQPIAANTAQTLNVLTLLYAIIPCGLKVLAILLVLRLPRKALAA